MSRAFTKRAGAVVGAVALFAAFLSVGVAIAGPSNATPSKEAAAKAYALQVLRSGKFADTLHGLKVLQSRAASASNNTTDVGSANWSGYADNNSAGNTYTSVSASWAEPKTTKSCSSISGETLTAFWIGLDGVSDGTVEQDGTVNVCLNGTGYDYDWYEMAPAGSIKVHDINPGDHITASVKDSKGKYVLAVTDSTNPGDSFSTKTTCSPSTCLDESAEWIGEAPCCDSTVSGFYPLTPYKTWVVTKASVNGSGTISSYPNYNITQYSKIGTYNLQVPGNLASKGTGFTDKFLASA
jgi:peptidase A4-like protein